MVQKTNNKNCLTKAHCAIGILAENFLRNKPFLGLLVVLFYLPIITVRSQGKNSLTGVVLDIETNLPLPNVNVFLDKSLMGSATDSSGRFDIKHVPAGSFQIVVSHIGYEVQKREINLTSEFKDRLVFNLRPTVLRGPEVVVKAEDEKQWRHDLERFTDLILSTTKNVAATKILNPHVLVFGENGNGQFQAVAREPLIIENRALGYKLAFVLDDFVATKQNLRYAGFTKFEELAPESEKQYQRWQKNRLRAYRGSLRHFLAIICDTLARIDLRLKEEGFEIFAFKHSWERESRRVEEPVNWRLFFRPGEQPHEIYLSFPDYLGVKYMNESEERGYLRYYQVEREAQVQESWIKLEQSVVKLDRKGHYYSDAAIMEFGYWAWERLADMLPLEYRP